MTYTNTQHSPRNILIGGAWPYANGSLHIGHIAALLPGDVLARYFRAKGDNVCYVSGSDCYGTPITVRAHREGCTPYEISERYHREFTEVFQSLGFSYDLYTKTSDSYHIDFVRNFHRALYAGGYTESRRVRQGYCPKCRRTLTDRQINGSCPSCGSPARGDQCEFCGEILEADTIADPRCAECGTTLEFVDSEQIYLKISALENELRCYLGSHPYWRRNAAAFTQRYITEGLRDRAITRDLDWGIDVPADGFEGKKIYIWAENVLGYFSAAEQVCRQRGWSFDTFCRGGNNGCTSEKQPETRHYYVHGKDNIPFHTIILPSLLIGSGGGYHLPDVIVSSEYLTLDGSKISTGADHAIRAHELTGKVSSDAARYFFIANAPEKRDGDFSWREFASQNNGELVGAWGNFVNRTLAFIVKYLGGVIPEGQTDAEVDERISLAFDTVGQKIEEASLRDALTEAFELVRFGNRYYDLGAPWKTRSQSPEQCTHTLYGCVQIIASAAALLEPFLPFSSRRVAAWLGLDGGGEWKCEWKPQQVKPGRVIDGIGILFERLDAEKLAGEDAAEA